MIHLDKTGADIMREKYGINQKTEADVMREAWKRRSANWQEFAKYGIIGALIFLVGVFSAPYVYPWLIGVLG